MIQMYRCCPGRTRIRRKRCSRSCRIEEGVPKTRVGFLQARCCNPMACRPRSLWEACRLVRDHLLAQIMGIPVYVNYLYLCTNTISLLQAAFVQVAAMHCRPTCLSDRVWSMRVAPQLDAYPVQQCSRKVHDMLRAQIWKVAKSCATGVHVTLAAGLQSRWVHKWRYDGNGQAYVQINGRWFQVQRPTGTKKQIIMYDVENKIRPGQSFQMQTPPDWPAEEVRWWSRYSYWRCQTGFKNTVHADTSA